MKNLAFPGLQTHGLRPGWRRLPLMPALKLLLIAAVAAAAGQSISRRQEPAQGLSATEFSRLIREFSEEGGYFHSDNFTSNETSYLQIADKLQQLGASRGAYIGVGPEQNFTYIAKLRPHIAFIVDIRRQAMIQHLMFKALFHLSPTRTQFLSRLLSKPLPQNNAPPADASVDRLLTFFDSVSGEDLAFAANLAGIRKAIREDFRFPLSERDQVSLAYVYRHFRNEGLNIAYEAYGWSGSYYPTLKDLMTETDIHGRPGNFLASVEDYEFVRGLHEKNLIIPLVGDFAGTKALAAVGEYLRKNHLTLSAYYTSNVEQFLFDSRSFAAFVGNVRRLPIDNRSLFIRSVAGGRYHPARLPGHRSATLLQQITVFLQDFDEGRYPRYRDLITTHYIAAQAP